MSVPLPPDDKEYLDSLRGEDKRIHELYKKIEESKDEQKLIDLVSSGQIKPTDTNREGQTPLMLSCDNNFSV